MARIVRDYEVVDTQSVGSGYALWKMALIGVSLGGLFYSLALVLDIYALQALFCNDNSSDVCSNTLTTAGDISTIIIAVVAIVLMVRLLVAQPLLIAVASAIALWGLASWTAGMFWLEGLAWSALLYTLVYSLFGWVVRHRYAPVLLAVSAISVAILRIAAAI